MLGRKARRKAIGWIWNLVVLAIILLPIISLIIGAIQTEEALLSDVRNPLPKEITLTNFAVLLQGGGGPRYPDQVRHFPAAFRNSAIVAGFTALLTLLFGALSAYTLARLQFHGRDTYSFVVLATRMVPVIVLVIPLYLTLRTMGLLNTLPGLIITETGFLLPFVIWILRAYFESLPTELEDAARVDGCTRLGSFFRIVVPLSAPGMAACFVISFLLSWNELIIPVTLGTKLEVQTLPVLLSSFVSDFSLQYSIVNATSLLALAPTVILALLLHRYVVAGLTAGAIKG